jgi:hypothetical protein
MHVKTVLAAVAVSSAASLALVPGPALAGNPHDVIRADLHPSLTTFPAINGALPGGVPWVLDRGEVRVRDDGRMDVRIDGLLVPAADGTTSNPVASVTAVLYCGGVRSGDSGPQALDADGDARFRADVGAVGGCDDATVLISPTAAVGARYIAFTA